MTSPAVTHEPFGDIDGAYPGPRAAYRPRLWQVAVAVVLFVLVALDVALDGLLRDFDHSAARWLLGFGVRDNDVSNTVGYLISQTGGRATNLVWIIVLCAVIFAQRRTLAPLLHVLSATALMYIALLPIKEGMARSYPTDKAGDYFGAVGSLGGAFPSGHQANATVLASVGAWIAIRYIRQRWLRRIIATYALVAPVVCAIAVLMLGYHWVSDVVAGTCAGIILLWIVRWFWDTPFGERLTERLSMPPAR